MDAFAASVPALRRANLNHHVAGLVGATPSGVSLLSPTRPTQRAVRHGATLRMAIEEVEYVKIFGRLGEKTLFGDSSAVR